MAFTQCRNGTLAEEIREGYRGCGVAARRPSGGDLPFSVDQETLYKDHSPTLI